MSKFGALLEQYVPDETFEVNIVDIGAEENCQAWTFKGIRDVATRKAWDSDAYKWATSKRVKDAVEAMGINPESCLESIRSAWYWAQTFVKSSTGDDKMTPAEALEFLRAPDLFQNINHQWERGQKTVNSRYLHALIEESKNSVMATPSDSLSQELGRQEADQTTLNDSE